jgi:hypothetical protein
MIPMILALSDPGNGLMPLLLSDDLYAVVQAAAAPVALRERGQFLQELVAELERCPTLGPGVVHRAAAELQRRFAVEARSTAIGRRQASVGALPPRLRWWMTTILQSLLPLVAP